MSIQTLRGKHSYRGGLMRMNEGQMGMGLVGVGTVVGGCLLERPQSSTLLPTMKHHKNMLTLGQG